MQRFIGLWEESTGLLGLTDGRIQNTAQCGGSGFWAGKQDCLMCGSKNTDDHRTLCLFFFLEVGTNVWMRPIGGASAASHRDLAVTVRAL